MSKKDEAPGHPAAGETATSGAERRRSERVPIEMWVEEISDESQVFRRAGNLSVGGLYLDKTIPIPIGTVVTLRFTLPGASEPLVVQAEIVSIDPALELGMGVKFVGLKEDARQSIAAFLDRALTPVGGVAVE